MTQTQQVTQKYPVGGQREPVYALMRGLGFKMGSFGDKHWTALDGIEVHIYGAGSMARITLKTDPPTYTECQLDDLAKELDDIRAV